MWPVYKKEYWSRETCKMPPPLKEESLDVNESSEIDNLIIFSCDQCNKSFKEKQLLDVHKWIHK